MLSKSDISGSACRAGLWALIVFFCGSLAAAEEEEKTPKVRETHAAPHSFKFTQLIPAKPPFKMGEQLQFKFGWQGLSAATAQTAFYGGKQNKQDVYKLELKVQTLSGLRWLWNMGDFSITLLDPKTFRPIAYYKSTQENGRLTKALIQYHFDQNVATMLKRRLKPDPKTSKRNIFFQDAHDPVSIFYLLRCMPLKVGSYACFEIVPDSNIYAFEAKVLGFEKIKVAAGKFDAAKVELKIHRLSGGKKKRERTAEKYDEVVAWVSTGPNRLPLRLESSVFVGHVFAELEKCMLGKDPLPVQADAPAKAEAGKK